MKDGAQLVTTIGEKCRVCYTCVRECPAKAIRIARGQAEVLPERCIGCGNCVHVCSQKAKRVYDSTSEVVELLGSPDRVAALLAPSFPAEFQDIPAPRLVGLLRRMGFNLVAETAFGADLVAEEYGRRLAGGDGRRYIATTCPAIVAYIEKYHDRLVPHLAPIASPMVAAARALRVRYGPDVRVVFIGPCLAKKQEADRARDVDAVLTFAELRELLARENLSPAAAEDSAFDPPRAGLGRLFPLSRGMLQAARVKEDLLAGDVVAADGRGTFAQAIREFESGALDARLLEILCCNGCIMGSGMTVDTPLFRRRAAVSQYARQRQAEPAEPDAAAGAPAAPPDLRVAFEARRLSSPDVAADQLRAILERMGKHGPEDELNCGACGYATCREHAAAIAQGLAESEMCLPYTIDRLRRSLEELNASNERLASTQQALVSAEKLASMGQLSAGIAHEVNNPIGVILLYAKMLLQDAPPDAPQRADLEMIAEQAMRCKKIVSGLLNFAREEKVVRKPTDLHALIDRALRSVQVPAGIDVAVERGAADPVAEVDEDQILQVIINLLTNSIEAMPRGGRLCIATSGDARQAIVGVSDTGGGIAPENLDKIFEPFFTTKQIGKGTGLGLAVSYGIAKMHRGRIDVVSNHDPARGPTGATFAVTLPRRAGEGGG
jgi:signal transduction histidine kinase/iron only hydrogenase large subunit-like protein